MRRVLIRGLTAESVMDMRYGQGQIHFIANPAEEVEEGH